MIKLENNDEKLIKFVSEDHELSLSVKDGHEEIDIDSTIPLLACMANAVFASKAHALADKGCDKGEIFEEVLGDIDYIKSSALSVVCGIINAVNKKSVDAANINGQKAER